MSTLVVLTIVLGVPLRASPQVLAQHRERPPSEQPAESAVPEIITDRPDVTDASTVVPRGSLLGENGATFTRDHHTRAIDATQSMLRLGVASRTELRLGIPEYLANFDKGRSGFGDISAGFKQQLGPLPGDFDLSVIMAVSLPTGARGVSSGGYDPSIKFPWSRELTGPWSVGGMFSLFWLTEEGRRNLTGQPTFYVERQITKAADVFVEYAADYPEHGAPRPIFHTGAAYRITPTNQIDLHIGLGLTRAAPDFFIGIGYSFRIDHVLPAAR